MGVLILILVTLFQANCQDIDQFNDLNLPTYSENLNLSNTCESSVDTDSRPTVQLPDGILSENSFFKSMDKETESFLKLALNMALIFFLISLFISLPERIRARE